MEDIKRLREEHEKRIKELEASENFLHYDFQGWPVFKKTLRELLIELGATEENGIIGFKIDNEILDIYPQKLTLDAMGYGIYEESIVQGDVVIDDKGNKYINIFTDTK